PPPPKALKTKSARTPRDWRGVTNNIVRRVYGNGTSGIMCYYFSIVVTYSSRSTGRILILLLIGALTSLPAGCGSGGNSASETNSTTQTKTPTPPPDGPPSPDGPPPTSQVGQWAGPFDWPIVSVNMALLPTGRVLAYDGQFAGH